LDRANRGGKGRVCTRPKATKNVGRPTHFVAPTEKSLPRSSRRARRKAKLLPSGPADRKPGDRGDPLFLIPLRLSAFSALRSAGKGFYRRAKIRGPKSSPRLYPSAFLCVLRASISVVHCSRKAMSSPRTSAWVTGCSNGVWTTPSGPALSTNTARLGWPSAETTPSPGSRKTTFTM